MIYLARRLIFISQYAINARDKASRETTSTRNSRSSIDIAPLEPRHMYGDHSPCSSEQNSAGSAALDDCRGFLPGSKSFQGQAFAAQSAVEAFVGAVLPRFKRDMRAVDAFSSARCLQFREAPFHVALHSAHLPSIRLVKRGNGLMPPLWQSAAPIAFQREHSDIS